ncbi:MAG: sialate O-acetylesterase [Armatimonadota bacterium]
MTLRLLDISIFTILPLVISAAGLLHASSAAATVKPNGLFTDGAVIQRDMPVPVWGTADNGEEITVKFHGQSISTVARDGKWMVRLEPMKAGGPYTMTITGSSKIRVKNIMVGDVWVCSGQSNMAFNLLGDIDYKEAASSSSDSRLRCLTVPEASSKLPIHDLSGNWREANPQTVGGFSAVGYYFARKLRESTKVPVGIIVSSCSGTSAEAWTNPRIFDSRPDLKGISDDVDWGTPLNKAGGCYNAMILPIIPYAIKGVIWYQGEGNSRPADAYRYRELFPLMVNDWRQTWGGRDFPFLYVQIPPVLNASLDVQESSWAELRESQLVASQAIPNSGMVVTTDAGDEYDIHPRWKRVVGERLALAARGLAYGEKIEYSGPIYKSMKVDDGRIIITFDHTGSGLVSKDGNLKGWAIAGEDGRFARARAEIIGDTVIVSNPGIPHPTAVRYGWADYPIVNLYNKEGLPASPFRTDIR